MNQPIKIRRRVVLAHLGSAAAAAAAWRAGVAVAQEAPHLDMHDPAAQALGYVENVSQLDHKKYPDYVPGSICDNCLQLQGAAGLAFRPCNLFKDKLVAATGWCSGWTPEI